MYPAVVQTEKACVEAATQVDDDRVGVFCDESFDFAVEDFGADGDDELGHPLFVEGGEVVVDLL